MLSVEEQGDLAGEMFLQDALNRQQHKADDLAAIYRALKPKGECHGCMADFAPDSTLLFCPDSEGECKGYFEDDLKREGRLH